MSRIDYEEINAFKLAIKIFCSLNYANFKLCEFQIWSIFDDLTSSIFYKAHFFCVYLTDIRCLDSLGFQQLQNQLKSMSNVLILTRSLIHFKAWENNLANVRMPLTKLSAVWGSEASCVILVWYPSMHQ